jgi:hypothetical protein
MLTTTGELSINMSRQSPPTIKSTLCLLMPNHGRNLVPVLQSESILPYHLNYSIFDLSVMQQGRQ